MRRTPSDTSQTSFRGRILTRWALAVAIGLAWLATAIPGADAQTSSKLVGNTDQHQNGVFQLNADEQGIAQTFTTGADRGAYLLESVWVVIDRSRDGRYIEIAGAIHRVEADGSRGTKVHDLTHAGVYANQAEYRFQTASAGLLIANRPYMVVISCTAGCANDNFLEFERTAWNGEDADGEADWSIADKAVKASDDWSPAGDVSNSLKIRLMGRHANKPYVESDGLTLASSPAAGDTYGAGETITLSLEFNTPVDVDTAGGTPQITMHIGDSSNPNREQNLAYARGSSTDTLVFEHIVQPTDVDADGIRIEGQSIDLNGSDITNPDNGRHAFRHFRGLNSGEPLSGTPPQRNRSHPQGNPERPVPERSRHIARVQRGHDRIRRPGRVGFRDDNGNSYPADRRLRNDCTSRRRPSIGRTPGGAARRAQRNNHHGDQVGLHPHHLHLDGDPRRARAGQH